MSFTQPAAAPSRPTAMIPLASIDASPFNPRQDFDKEGIAELAASIAARGLLENLVVRPLQGGRYQLMGGERRLRALRLNKATEARCHIVEADDAEAIAIQIVENLQRHDLGPLEEAEAFARLQQQDPKKWTPQEIAKAVGKTDRFVQQRIAIASGLSAPLKEKFAAGEISVEAARTLAPLPAAVQASIPDWAIARGDAKDIRRLGFELCIPEAAAKFDVAAYKGGWIEGDKDKRFFADTRAFMALQMPAAEKLLAEVRRDWPAAKLMTEAEAAGMQWADQQYVSLHYGTATTHREGDKPAKYLVPKENCTAIVWIAANGQIRKALGVCTAAAVTAAETKRSKARNTSTTSTHFKSPAGEKKDHKLAREAFNAAVAKAAEKDAAFADRLFIFRAVNDDLGIAHNIAIKVVPKQVVDAEGKDVDLWAAVASLTTAQANKIARQLLLGSELPVWENFEHNEKPTLLVAIAKSLGVTPPAIALPDPPAVKATAKPATKAKPAPKAKAKKKGGRK